MVSTRRRSKAGPSTKNAEDVEPDANEDAFEEGSESDREASDASDSPPPAKRARKARQPVKKVVKKTPIKKQRGAGKLSMLLTMPLDILYEVFHTLEPQDLLAVARTNKLLRDTLMSPQAVSVWITIRKRVGAPEPPPGHSEPWWANLMFGKKRCQVCGCLSVNNVDWQLLMRVCTRCKKKNLLTPIKFKKEFPDSDASVLDLVLYTNVGGHSHGHASNTKFYWRDDVERMLEKIASYKKDRSEKKSAADTAYEAFRERRIDYVSAVAKLAPQWANWASNHYWGNFRDGERLAELRKKAIKEKLLQLGYDERDTNRALNSFQMTVEKKELTDLAWKKIRPKWEEEVNNQRRDRLDRDYKDLIKQRKHVAAELYNVAYRKHVGPREWTSIDWLSIPPSYSIFELEPIRDLVYTDVEKTVPAGHFQQALQSCASRIRELTEKQTLMVQQLICEARKAVMDAKLIPKLKDLNTEVLDLALATCANGGFFVLTPYVQCLRAQDYIFAQNCGHMPRVGSRPMYNVDLSVAVAGLLDTLELPATTTFAQLDELDPRVFCAHCKPMLNSELHIRGRMAYGWRSAAIHYKQEHRGCGRPRWELLSDEEASYYALSCKEHDLADVDTWSCAHCNLHLNHWQTLEQAKAHVKQVHGSEDPRIVKDVLCMPANPVHIKPVFVVKD
ncbi:hypothetical protein GGG16DRAFT_114695 [Schizophyllum commune]